MATSIGLPSLTIKFQAAAQAAANRSKKGFVGVIVRDTKAQGVHALSSAALIPTELGEANRAYLAQAFTGSDRGKPSKVVAVVIAPGGKDAEGTSALEGGLRALEGQSLDYIAGPPDISEEEKTVLQDWIKARRKAYRTEKAVVPKAVAPDDMGVISFDEDGLTVGGKAVTAAQYGSRIAGILAGIPMSMSCTNAVLPEVTAVTARSVAEQVAAVDAGKLILVHDGLKAKIARGVNALTTIPVDGKDDWRKIKIVEGMDLITYYLRTTIEDEYIGMYANTYDNKCVLVTAITDYFHYLEAAGVLEQGLSGAEIDVEAQRRWLQASGVEVADLTEQQIKEHNTGAWVFLSCTGRLVDAMEDFQIIFNNQ